MGQLYTSLFLFTIVHFQRFTKWIKGGTIICTAIMIMRLLGTPHLGIIYHTLFFSDSIPGCQHTQLTPGVCTHNQHLMSSDNISTWCRQTTLTPYVCRQNKHPERICRPFIWFLDPEIAPFLRPNDALAQRRCFGPTTLQPNDALAQQCYSSRACQI